MLSRFWYRSRQTPHTTSQPTIVHGIPARRPSAMNLIQQRRRRDESSHFPSPSSFRFENIMAAVETQEFQSSIDAIAVLYAKSCMSLANAHDAHRPPHVDESAFTSRPGRTLSIVPEANSSGETSDSDDGQRARNEDPRSVDRENSQRQIAISSIPGLRRLTRPCEPIVSLSDRETDTGYRPGGDGPRIFRNAGEEKVGGVSGSRQGR